MDGEELTGERRSTFRSACMRLAYLPADRPELQFLSKEAATIMQRPTVIREQMLKRATRFLIGCPRTVVKYARQRAPRNLDMYTDSNHAGCTQARKSTSSMAAMYGQHWLRSTATTQGIIALSSGESEFHAVVKGTSSALGLQVMLADYGVVADIVVHVDATAVSVSHRDAVSGEFVICTPHCCGCRRYSRSDGPRHVKCLGQRTQPTSEQSCQHLRSGDSYLLWVSK